MTAPLAEMTGRFHAAATADAYVATPYFEEILAATQRAIDESWGPVAIVGGPGSGKSMLAAQLAARAGGQSILLSSSQLTNRRDLLKSILHNIQLPFRGLLDGELQIALKEHLQYRCQHGGGPAVLIVDEAQALSPRLLEELRLLTNLQVGATPCLALVLIGSLRLEEMLSHPQLASLQQRLAAKHFLHPLDSHQTRQYIDGKCRRIGASRLSRQLDQATVDAIQLTSGGVPRLIDQVLDRTLELMQAAHEDDITALAVQTAWQRLYEAVPPWISESPITLADGQDGELSGEQDDAPERLAAAGDMSQSYTVLVGHGDEELDLPAEEFRIAEAASEQLRRSQPAAAKTGVAEDSVAKETHAAAEIRLLAPVPSAGKGLSQVLVQQAERPSDTDGMRQANHQLDYVAALENHWDVESDLFEKIADINSQSMAFDIESVPRIMINRAAPARPTAQLDRNSQAEVYGNAESDCIDDRDLLLVEREDGIVTLMDDDLGGPVIHSFSSILQSLRQTT